MTGTNQAQIATNSAAMDALKHVSRQRAAHDLMWQSAVLHYQGVVMGFGVDHPSAVASRQVAMACADHLLNLTAAAASRMAILIDPEAINPERREESPRRAAEPAAPLEFSREGFLGKDTAAAEDGAGGGLAGAAGGQG